MDDDMMIEQDGPIEEVAKAISEGDGHRWMNYSDPSYVHARYRRLAQAAIFAYNDYLDKHV